MIKDILYNLNDDVSSTMPSAYTRKINKYEYAYIPLFINNSNSEYSYKCLQIDKHKYNYGDLVDLFIKLIYSYQEMTAIINNYLLDPTNVSSLSEFNEMQAIRKEAKELAKEILEKYPVDSLNEL